MANTMQVPIGELLDEERLQKLDETLSELLEELLPLFGDDDDDDDDKEMDEIIEAAVEQLALEYVNPDMIGKVLFTWSRRLYDLSQNVEDDDDGEDKEGDGMQINNLLQIAVVCGRVAVQRLPQNSPDHLDAHYHMCCMMTEFEKAELNTAVKAARRMWEHHKNAQSTPRSREALEQLAATLNMRYLEFRDPSDLEEALQLTHDPGLLTTELLEIQAQSHESMFERNGLLPEIDQAIKISEQILHISHVDLDEAIALSNLSRRLRCRSRNTNKESDLESAINYARRAVQLSINSEDIRGSCLSSLTASLTTRYDRTGGEKIISEAMDNAQEALDLESQRGHPTRAVWMNDLAAAYLSRYIREQEFSDADQAILLAQQSLDIDSKRVSQMLVSFNIWFLALAKKFEISQQSEFYEAAKHVAQKLNRILSSTAADDPIRGLAHLNVGWLLQCQYRKTSDIADLDKAIKAAENAIVLLPNDDPFYSSAISNLGIGLMCLYEKNNTRSDLERAIEMYQQAASRTPDVFNRKIQRLKDLATAYEKRYLHTGMKEDADIDMALNLFKDASQNIHGPPLDRIECARSAVSIYISKKEWSNASMLVEETLKLVPFACRRYTSREAQQHAISQVSSIASVAASLSLQAGNATKALQQLEFGRGLIFGYTIDDRGGLLALRREFEDLARNYESLRYQVDADEIEDYRKAPLPAHLINEWSTGLPGQLAKEWREEIARELHKTRREALVEIEACVDKIRKLSGYEQFQMSLDMNEMKRQAIEGPILVVNVSNLRADAIIVTPSEVKALQLPKRFLDEAPQFSSLTPTQMNTVVGSRKATVVEEEPGVDLYSWLWTNCVELILDELATIGYLGPKVAKRPRVWWIGCGMASSFPFHAAGIDFRPSSLENTLSRVIPSYTPTIKALVHSRLRASIPMKDSAEKPHVDSILLVTMPTTIGQKNLPGVGKERIAIQRSCQGVYRVKELRLPDAKTVIEALDEAKIAHFACHGSSDPTNPYESHLLLQKNVDGIPTLDRLTMLEVSKLAAEQQLWVAFLSACSTVQVKASKYADEGLHLASAFQVAGFAHVIGALWPANDDACARIAGEFYGELASHSREVVDQRVVAEALWQAVMRIRSEPNSDISLWAPFVHMGA